MILGMRIDRGDTEEFVNYQKDLDWLNLIY